MNTKTVSIAAIFIIVIAAVAAFGLYRTASVTSEPTATSTPSEQVACTLEAKICPDGSSVGRGGPNCEFAACPVAATTTSTGYHTGDTATVTARIGQTVSVLGEKIKPMTVLDDSRCPADVQCIWAGTVRVRVSVETGMGKSDMTFELGKEATTEVNSITLVSVAPAKKSTQTIATGDYVFTFKVTRR